MSPKHPRFPAGALGYGLAAFLLVVALALGSAVAEAQEPIRLANAPAPATGLEGDGLGDAALAEIRGQGAEADAPESAKRVGVILWDEGKGPGRSNTSNRADGSGNVQTNRTQINGR